MWSNQPRCSGGLWPECSTYRLSATSANGEYIRRLFDGPNYAHQATLLPDGGPHSVPQYLERPYPLRTDRVVFLIEPEHARAITNG